MRAPRRMTHHIAHRVATVIGAATVVAFTWTHIAVAASFNIHPDASAPGVSGLQKLTDLIAEYSFLTFGIGAVASLLLTGIAKGFHLERLSTHGREGVLVCVIGLFVLGIIPTILSTAYNL